MRCWSESGRWIEPGPAPTEADLEAFNEIFRHFIFRRRNTREFWATCCRKHVDAGGDPLYKRIFAVRHTSEPRRSWESTKDFASMEACPICGRPAEVKDLGKTGKRQNLRSYQKVFWLKWFNGALWGTVWECYKDYEKELLGLPKYYCLARYKFTPGLVLSRTSWQQSVQEGPLKKNWWHILEPYTVFDGGYDALFGWDEIWESPFKYCLSEQDLKYADHPARLLGACCFYPRQIEMMLKAGMRGAVYDLADKGKKHAAVINWDTNDPKKIFRLQKQEARQFMQTDKDIQIPELYLKFKRRVPMEECAVMISKGLDMAQLFELAKKWNVEPVKLARYLLRFVWDGSNGRFVRYSQVISCWKDYLSAAQALQEPLHRDNVLMPPNLPQAHEDATERHRLRLEQERAERDRERQTILDKQKLESEQKLAQARREYAERRKKLEEKYAFEMDGYEIRVPQNEDEIVAEGIALKHCVSGYAARHIEGKLTILFMRKSVEPDVPWLTIEMNGNAMRQIHGYKNEGLYTVGGRFAPNPREVYAEWLDTWLVWLKAGSKRNEDGSPKLPKKKGAAA